MATRAVGLLALLLAALVPLARAQDGEETGRKPVARERDPAKLLAAADREFRNEAYEAAVRLYSEALSVAPLPRTYYARMKANLKLKKLPAAISDLTEALARDPGFAMAYSQRANLLLMTGRCGEAAADYQTVLRLDPSKRDAQARLPHAQACAAAVERADYAARAGDWRGQRDALDAAMEPERATASPALMLAHAEASLAMGDLDQAVADAARVLKMEGGNLAAYALRARALGRLGDYASARQHAQECLVFDPEHGECLAAYRILKTLARAKDRGDTAMAEGRWRDAVELWQDSLAAMAAATAASFTVDSSGGGGTQRGAEAAAVAVHFAPVWQRETLPKLARAAWKAGDLDGAERWARAAIGADDGAAAAHHVLAEVLLAKEAWEDAVRAAHRAHELDRGHGEYRDAVQRADAALKQSRSKDYYKILGVPRSADEPALKRAYRGLARQWHPDLAQGGEEERAAFEAKFRDIAEAYDVLTDAEKRQKCVTGRAVWPGGVKFGPPRSRERCRGRPCALLLLACQPAAAAHLWPL